MTSEHWEVGDEITLLRIDFTGHVVGVVATRDPVVTIRAKGGAELTMCTSLIVRSGYILRPRPQRNANAL